MPCRIKSNGNFLYFKRLVVSFNIKINSCKFTVTVFHKSFSSCSAVYILAAAYGMIAVCVRNYCFFYRLLGIEVKIAINTV